MATDGNANKKMKSFSVNTSIQHYNKIITNMSNKVIQPELFIKYLPEDLSRYTYKFIYRDVKVSLWRHKYNMHDLLDNLYDYCGGYEYFPDAIIEMFRQYFPNDIHKIADEWFILERVRERGLGWLKYYRLPYFWEDEEGQEEESNKYFEGLYNAISAILDEKTPDELYGLLAGLVLIHNKQKAL